MTTADGGGSNGPRSRLWKSALQRVADDFDLTLAVCHLPPGTSTWNKIEHRLFRFISQNWRGTLVVNHHAIVNLIAATTTPNRLARESGAVSGTTPSRRAIEPGVRVVARALRAAARF